ENGSAGPANYLSISGVTGTAGNQWAHLAADPVWDFDTAISGTDSTQGWIRVAIPYTSGGTRAANTRPEWALDFGNNVNNGNTNLWAARTGALRSFVKTGVAGAWHSDTMAGVKLKLNDGAEPSSLPIAGSRSAWCGLRESGNQSAS